MDVTAKTNDIYLTLTPRDFSLITKALVGTLNPKPHERLGYDDIPDAKALGKVLMTRRLTSAQAEVDRAQRALTHAFEEGEGV
jgi:hypothetical protein